MLKGNNMTDIITQIKPYINNENLSILFGQVMPLVIAALNKYVPDSSKWRMASTIAISAIMGILVVAVDGKFDLNQIVPSFALVFASSQVAYRYWFKGSNVEARITR